MNCATDSGTGVEKDTGRTKGNWLQPAFNLVFFQEKKFSRALRQSIALDRRTGEEDAQIFQLAQMALNNRNYSDAQKAYEYLLGKGEKNPFYKQSYAQNIHASYMEFVTENKADEQIERK